MISRMSDIEGDALNQCKFEPAFYIRAYPDVKEAAVDPAEHYAEFGLNERRYGAVEQLEADIEAIKFSGLFDFSHFNEQNGSSNDPIRDYLLNKWRTFSPTGDFDSNFIESYYPKSLALGEHPFAFYCRNYKQPWCYPSLKSAQTQVAIVNSSPLFSSVYFLRENGVVTVEDPATYYCTEGYRLLADPSSNFSTAAYLLKYPDIAAARINPLLHYIQHGKAEGRSAFSTHDLFRAGEQIFHRAKPSVLICSHEASRSGAPIVALNLAKHLGAKFNVFTVLLRSGALSDEFSKVSNKLMISGDTIEQMEIAIDALMRRHKIDTVILNSVECTKLLPTMVKYNVSSVSLLHEFAQYVWPFNLLARAITLSDAVVFPSKLVEQEGLKEAQQLGLGSMHPTNLHIRPQGRSLVPFVATDRQTTARLPPRLQALSKAKDRPLVVLGAGQVQPRKGVDLFIEAARILKHDYGVNCHFVWVGSGYAPKTDLGISVYLADQVERSDLADVVTFVPEQATLQPFWDLADAFFMSSRLDPFPNVALDAVAECLPVVCFQKATGIADLAIRWPDRIHAAPYNDARDAALVFADLSEKRNRGESLRLPASADVEHFLSFARYADEIAELVNSTVARRDRRKRLAQSLESSPRFVPQLLAKTLPDWLRTDGKTLWAHSGGLAELAAASANNGVPIGYVWQGKITALTDPSDPSCLTWGGNDFQVMQIGSESETQLPYSAIAFVDDQSTLDALSDVLFQMVEVGHVAIVTTSLEEADIATLRATAGLNNVSLHCASPDSVAKTLTELNACISGIKLIHLMKSRATQASGSGKDAGVTLSASAIRSAFSMLAAEEGVQIVLQQPDWTVPFCQAQTNRHSPTHVSGAALPDRLVDQTQAWIRLDPEKWTDHLLQDMLCQFATGSLDGVWDCTAQRVRHLSPAQRGLIYPQFEETDFSSKSQDRRDRSSRQHVSVKARN